MPEYLPNAEVQEHLKQHPDHAGWAFSFIEITRQKAFLLDGKSPTLPENGGIGLWFAPVNPSQLVGEILKDRFDAIIAPSLGIGAGTRDPDPGPGVRCLYARTRCLMKARVEWSRAASPRFGGCGAEHATQRGDR